MKRTSYSPVRRPEVSLHMAGALASGQVCWGGRHYLRSVHQSPGVNPADGSLSHQLPLLLSPGRAGFHLVSRTRNSSLNNKLKLEASFLGQQ